MGWEFEGEMKIVGTRTDILNMFRTEVLCFGEYHNIRVGSYHACVEEIDDTLVYIRQPIINGKRDGGEQFVMPDHGCRILGHEIKLDFFGYKDYGYDTPECVTMKVNFWKSKPNQEVFERISKEYNLDFFMNLFEGYYGDELVFTCVHGDTIRYGNSNIFVYQNSCYYAWLHDRHVDHKESYEDAAERCGAEPYYYDDDGNYTPPETTATQDSKLEEE